jgi:predicted  nucleic acid-binding Zn-ribbon protein
MKFSRLVKIVTEAKDEKPGQRYFSAQNRQGPAGMVSGPIGKVDNFELRKKLNRWEFNPEVDMDNKSKSGFQEASAIWNAMTNAFGILANDDTFQAEASKIADEFDKNRDAFRQTLGIGEDDITSYDEEAKSNSLPNTIQKQESRLEGFGDEIRKAQRSINHANMSPGEVYKLKKTIASIRTDIKSDEEQLKKETRWKQKNQLEQSIDNQHKRLAKLEGIYDETQYNETTLNFLKARIVDNQKKVSDLTKKVEANKAEWEELIARTTQIEENNQKNNDYALEQFKHLITSSARKLGMKLRNESSNKERLNDLSQVQWDTSLASADTKTKIAMLDSLASSDPNINPVLGYVDRFAKSYYGDEGEGGEAIHVKELDSREFNPQLNISKTRDYNNLPFVRLLRIYSAIREGAKNPQIPLVGVDMNQHNKAYAALKTALTEEAKRKPVDREWDDRIFKSAMVIHIKDLAIPDKEKQDLYDWLNKPWSVNKRGFTMPMQLMSRIDSYCKDVKKAQELQAESFDRYYDKIIQGIRYNEDDFKLDMVEILTRFK